MAASPINFTYPKIPDIHNKVLEAVSNPQALDMSNWHSSEATDEQGAYCGTTHCRAGWVVTLAGKEGVELEKRTSTLFAAMMIYQASSDIRVSPPRFYENNEKALEDITRCAKEETALHLN